MKVLLFVLSLGFSFSVFADDVKISTEEATKAIAWNFTSGGYDPFYQWQKMKLNMETLEVKRERFTRVVHFGDLYSTRIQAVAPINGQTMPVELRCPVEVFRMTDNDPKSATFYRIGNCHIYNLINGRTSQTPINKEPTTVFMGWGKLPKNFDYASVDIDKSK